MTLASCGIGTCLWEVDFPDEAAAEKGRAQHHLLRHAHDEAETVHRPEPLAQQLSFDSAGWRTRALDSLVRLAAAKDAFTIYEVTEFGVDEPPNPRADWGALTRDAAHMGVIKHVCDSSGRDVSTRSQRPETKGSLVFVWTAGERTA